MRSTDGTVTMQGELVRYDENEFVLATALGEVHLPINRFSCDGDNCPVFAAEDADFIMAGSDTVAIGVMPLLISGYAAFLGAELEEKVINASGDLAGTVKQPGLGTKKPNFLISSTSPYDAFENLGAQTIDIALTSEGRHSGQTRLLAQVDASETQDHLLAIDSLVVITHPSNPVRELSLAQMRDIYSGKATN